MSDMTDKVSVIKTLIVPALISLSLFLLLTYILLPLYRRHRQTYANYTPLRFRPLSFLNFRERIADLANRREDRHLNDHARAIDTHDETIGDDDAGEELDEVDDHMRLVIESHARAVATRERLDSLRRLSRDLEEGFRDDSDDEPER